MRVLIQVPVGGSPVYDGDVSFVGQCYIAPEVIPFGSVTVDPCFVFGDAENECLALSYV